MNPSSVPDEPLPDPIQHASERPDARWWQLQRSSRRPWRRALGAGLGSAAAVAVLGLPLGLLWRQLSPDVPVVDTGQGILPTGYSPEQWAAADSWFALLGLGFGVLVSLAAWFLLRRDRGPFLLLGVVVGAGIAGAWVAPWIGGLSGREAYEQWKDVAVPGATYVAPPELHSIGPALVPAFIAAIVLTLLAGWSNDPDLDHPGALPGYGPNHAYPGAPYYGPDAYAGPVQGGVGEPAGEPVQRDPHRPA